MRKKLIDGRDAFPDERLGEKELNLEPHISPEQEKTLNEIFPLPEAHPLYQLERTAAEQAEYEAAWNELEWNGESIDWVYWAGLPLLTAKQASCLVRGVDPNNWDSRDDPQLMKGCLPRNKIIEIKNSILQAESEIKAGRIREDDSPWGWICWAENKGVIAPLQFRKLAFESAKAAVHQRSVQPLEAIAQDKLSWYVKQDSWDYIEAIFLIHGYQPPCEGIAFDELLSHFPDAYRMLVRGIEVGAVGREITRSGQKNFIDTPENWRKWGQSKGIGVEDISQCEDGYFERYGTDPSAENYPVWQEQLNEIAEEMKKKSILKRYPTKNDAAKVLAKKLVDPKGMTEEKLQEKIYKMTGSVLRRTEKSWGKK